MPIEGATQEPQRVISAMQRQPVRACFGWIPTWKHIPGASLCDMNTSLWWNTSHPTGTALKVICPFSAGVFPLSNNRKSALGSHREWGWSSLGESGGRNTPTFLLNNCNPLTFTWSFAFSSNMQSKWKLRQRIYLFGRLEKDYGLHKKQKHIKHEERWDFLICAWISAHLKVTPTHILHALIYMDIRGWFVILTGFTMDLRCHSLKNTPPSATNELRDQNRAERGGTFLKF